MTINGFAELKFGYSDAHTEAREDPALLLGGFYDPFSLVDQVMGGARFLVLGPKGSGKSAFAVHLDLMASSELAVRTIMLADFPFQDFSSIQAGGVTKEARYPAAWKWLLCLALLSSFENDEGAEFSDFRPFRDSLRVLRGAGWLPEDSLKPLVLENTRKSTVELKLPMLGIGNETASRATGIPFPAAIETVTQLALRFRSNRRHLIVVDGLDDLIINSAVQWDVLSALLVAASRLNGTWKLAA